MKHAAIYAMGIVTGCAALVLADRFMPTAEAAALPPPTILQDASGSWIMTAVGNSGGGGGDILWVVYKRPLSEEESAKMIGNPRDGIFLTAYRAPAGAGAVDVNLHAARNITLDFLLTEHSGGPLDLEGVVNKVKDEMEQAKKKKK